MQKTINVENKELAARFMAVQAFYQIVQNQKPIRDVVSEYLKRELEIDPEVEGSTDTTVVKPDGTLFKKILFTLDERMAEVDVIVKSHMKQDSEKDKTPEPLLYAILMCGVCEVLAHTDIDKALIIDDYLNVTHGFYAPAQVSLVNGILDNVAKLVRD